MDRALFARTLGGIFENSPWVAERAWAARPFATLSDLHGAMVSAVREAPEAERLGLLRAHPDLAGKTARAGTLTAASSREQAAAGLSQLTPDEYARFDRLNAAYREAFGFPFAICVRNHTKASILAAFERRLGHTRAAEIDAALAEVFEITRYRLEDLLGVGSAPGPAGAGIGPESGGSAWAG